MTAAIIGGGASGLVAAITAVAAGHAVTLYERQARVGRKLLATGNGRCNLTNMNTNISHYHGEDAAFAEYALSELTPERALEFFSGLGLETVSEPDGKVYPFSDQAGSVVDVLRFAAEERGVETVTGVTVSAIRKKNSGFLVETDAGSRYFDRVIVCCGGAAGGKLGGTTGGYELLCALGHTRTKIYPALVQLKTETDFVKSLKGVRADAGVTLRRGKAVLARTEGEVQFTEYGVSGPAVFEVSRAAVRAGDGAVIELDLARYMGADDIKRYITRRVADMPSLTLENLFTGFLHNRLGRTLIRCAGCDLNAPVTSLADGDIDRIAATVKGFTLKITGNMGLDNAQVTAGGVSTREFDPRTMQSLIVPGLYAAGEVLDIDGDCGGFNLQWAWASGVLAGKLL